MSHPDRTTRTARRTLAATTLGFFGGFAGVSIVGPLAPRFAELLHLSPVIAALLAATPNLTGSLLRIPFGALYDRLGGRRPFLFLLAVTNVAVLGLLTLLHARYPDHLAGSLPLLFLLAALAGFGVATFSVGVGQISGWYSADRQGRALGIYAGLGNLGPALSALLLPIAVTSLGIVGGYGMWLVILVVLTVLYALFARDAARIGSPVRAAPSALVRAASRRTTWMLVSGYFVSFGGFLGLTAWLPSYWHAMYGLSLRESGLLTASFAATAALARVPGGILADRLASHAVLLTANAGLVGGIAVLCWSSSLPLSLGATLIVAAAMGVQNAWIFRTLPMCAPDAVGSAAGWVGGLGALGGFALPPLIGWVTSLVGGRTGYAQGFLPIAAAAALVLPALLRLASHVSGRRVGLITSQFPPESGARSSSLSLRRLMAEPSLQQLQEGDIDVPR
ncbi:MAG: MFS transporter [Acidothermus cellulolyticus]|nr:MFS transporter [Acidothermus cellulolyticus]